MLELKHTGVDSREAGAGAKAGAGAEAEAEAETETGTETETISVERIDIVESPQFNVKINSTMRTMVLDTVATGSMISLELCELSNLRVYPFTHSAILADGDSKLQVIGEVHTSIAMDGYLKL